MRRGRKSGGKGRYRLRSKGGRSRRYRSSRGGIRI